MNKILLILLFISINLNAQSTFELCSEEIQKEIRANTSSNISWSVNPLIPYQINNDVMTITITNIGTYVITAEFSNGECYSENKLVLKIIECQETFIWIPNSFTPNSDGNNDEFGAYGINIKEFNITVWDRWGNLIFESNNINKRWNGEYLNKMCQNDIYVYKVSYKNTYNKYHEKFGKITLIN